MKKGLPLLQVFLLVSLISCSDKLTESNAETFIKKGEGFPKTEDVEIRYGLIADEQDSLPKFYYLLQQKGMFTVERLGKGGLFLHNYRFKVTPTAEGKKYITKEDPNPMKEGNNGYMYNSRFKTCEVNFNYIENVQEMPDLNGADVKYTVRRSNFSPFWTYYLDKVNMMPDTIQEWKFVAIRTSNGWKPYKYYHPISPNFFSSFTFI